MLEPRVLREKERRAEQAALDRITIRSLRPVRQRPTLSSRLRAITSLRRLARNPRGIGLRTALLLLAALLTMTAQSCLPELLSRVLADSPPSAPQPPRDSEPMLSCLVTRVLDGDTVHLLCPNLGALTLRLAGIDAPELHHPKKPVERCGAEAKAMLLGLVEGKHVHVEWTGKDEEMHYDVYGRALGYIFRYGDVQQKLLRTGMARVYRRSPGRYRVQYEALEELARAAGLGIWGTSGIACAPVPPAKVGEPEGPPSPRPQREFAPRPRQAPPVRARAPERALPPRSPASPSATASERAWPSRPLVRSSRAILRGGPERGLAPRARRALADPPR